MGARLSRPVVALALTLVVCALAGAGTAFSATPSAPARYLVVFNSNTLPSDAAQRVTKNGGTVVRSFAPIGVIAAAGDASFVSKMSSDSKVQSVGIEHAFRLPETTMQPVPDDTAVVDGGPTTFDSLYGYQWDMRRIGAPNVWARLPLSATTPRVAVLDVGVADDHPDLTGKIDRFVSTSYCSTSGGPNNTASYPIYSTLIDFDAYPSWTPADGCTPAVTDYEAHGTHVAGTIAARFGGGRVVGVAPDANVGAYKVFDRFRFTDADGVHDGVGAFDGPLFSAIIQATLAGYPVINMSLGGTLLRNDKGSNASWLAWNRVAQYANKNGTLLVASAGNSAYNLNGVIAHVPSDISTVMNTSATGISQLVFSSGQFQPAAGATDVLAFYSNYGSPVDIAAPGGDCGPTYPNGCEPQYFILNDYIFPTGALGYAFFAGTSMATPHVSATAAYVRAIHPLWTPGAVRSWLKETATPIGDRQLFGAGLVNADAAAH